MYLKSKKYICTCMYASYPKGMCESDSVDGN